MIKITAQQLADMTGSSLANATSILNDIQSAMDKYSISDNAKRVAAFLANIGVESGGLLLKRENLNYTAARMAVVWPTRYAVDSHAATKVPNALAVSLAGNPVALGNNVYANRLGNGNEASGDGYKYRGGSYIQTTGKTEWQEAFEAIGLPTDSDPNVICTSTAYAALDSAAYFAGNGCNQLADLDQMSNTVLKINGALPSNANNGPLRLSRYRLGVAALS